MVIGRVATISWVLVDLNPNIKCVVATGTVQTREEQRYS